MHMAKKTWLHVNPRTTSSAPRNALTSKTGAASSDADATKYTNLKLVLTSNPLYYALIFPNRKFIKMIYPNINFDPIIA